MGEPRECGVLPIASGLSKGGVGFAENLGRKEQFPKYEFS
jgi:hypothetical protein